ncbi:MAG: hypothetical protein KME19_09915 [Microcoleus vaginatus WJT46-NPBG5]|nr:hypothetical protein [Microcoleus vaginatus WJT46-NPBG5]
MGFKLIFCKGLGAIIDRIRAAQSLECLRLLDLSLVPVMILLTQVRLIDYDQRDSRNRTLKTI